MSWLGSPTREHNACIANATAKVKTANELRDKELILGDTGPGTGTRSYPKVLNDLLGYKFKLVSGFRSSADVFLAMERGEVDGICESLDSINQRKPEWIPNKIVNVLLQAGAESRPELAGVPNVLTLARNDEERQVLEYLYAGQDIGRPFVAPPDLPPERLKMLRDAFNATMKDPEFVADVKRNKFDLEPEDGEHLAALIDEDLRDAEADHRARQQSDQVMPGRSDRARQRGARLARMRCKVRRCMLSRRAVSDTLRPHNS